MGRSSGLVHKFPNRSAIILESSKHRSVVPSEQEDGRSLRLLTGSRDEGHRRHTPKKRQNAHQAFSGLGPWVLWYLCHVCRPSR